MLETLVVLLAAGLVLAAPALARPLAEPLASPEGVAASSTTLAEISVSGTSRPSAPGETAGSLTVPSVAAQRAALNATVGSVAFVDAAAFQDLVRAAVARNMGG